jgi:hypothetical protein
MRSPPPRGCTGAGARAWWTGPLLWVGGTRARRAVGHPSAAAAMVRGVPLRYGRMVQARNGCPRARVAKNRRNSPTAGVSRTVGESSTSGPLWRESVFSSSLRTSAARQVVQWDGDSAAKLLEATAKLVGVVIWPAAIGYILVRFGSNIGDFISNLGEMTLKGGGFEASVKRRQNEAEAALVAATISRPEEGETVSAANAEKEAALTVGEVNARTLRRIEDSQVLWVDDRPDQQ